MKLRAFCARLFAAFPNLRRLTGSALRGTPGVSVPCAALLLVMYMLEAACVPHGWGAGLLIGLMMNIAVLPVTAAMITYAVGAVWERRSATIVDAYHLARIRMKEIVITGLAAGALLLLTNWLVSMISVLVGIIPALLGWLPGLGAVITGAVSAVFWLISLALEFLAHAVLVMGMLSLTADGVTGRAQAERAISILRGGREKILYELGLVFLLWIAVRGLNELLNMPLLISGVILAALAVVSMAAVSVVYLKERDRQDGIRYNA